jgi:capsular exopolysaccharide synthesis family protein
VEAPKSPVAESFRQLYAQVSHLFATNGAEDGVVFAITSSRAQEGKSTIASNLALSFAQFGTPTLLVDADLERSTMGKVAGVSGRPGVADFLRAEAPWEVIVNRSDTEGLTVIGAGTRPSHPPTLLASPRLETLVETARQRFPFTIVDVPPVFPVADVALVAGAIRKFLVIVRSGVVSHQELEGAVHTLKQVGGEILGVVLNGAELMDTYGYGYGYYRYYSRYGYGRDREAEDATVKER